MSIRNKLKGAKTFDEGSGVPVSTAPTWNTGELPITWAPEELKRLGRQTLRRNWKRGAITKAQYLRMLEYEG